ncbi:MAG: holo-ACP synthase [Gammaproteobacteria bacterium]
MIAGIGNDVADIRRVRKILSRHPRRFPARLLTDTESREFAARGFAPSYLAGRIAAKEALAKALRGGLRAPMTWRGVSVLSGEGGDGDERGAPSFCFSPPLAEHLRERGVSACHLSIAHDGDYAAAVVVAEKT